MQKRINTFRESKRDFEKWTSIFGVPKDLSNDLKEKSHFSFKKRLFVSAGGLEPPTFTLKGCCSTTELRALMQIFEGSNIN